MGVFREFIIESSTEIQTTPEEIWDFFFDIEDNYKKWHPSNHHFWRWT
jgi:hypothetical protein